MEVDSSTDPTERCRRLEERLSVLSDSMAAFAEATVDSQRLLDTVARRVAEVVKDYCIGLLLSDDGRTLIPAAIFDPDPEALVVPVTASGIRLANCLRDSVLTRDPRRRCSST